MDYQALITIELWDVNQDERNEIYEYLNAKGWEKIGCVSTTWKASISTNVTINNQKEALADILKKAVKRSKTGNVEYVIQIGEGDVLISKLIGD